MNDHPDRERDLGYGRGSAAMGPDSDSEAVQQLLEQVVEKTQSAPFALYHDLDGAGAVVTGGATGIGRAIALELAQQGTHIALNFLEEDAGAHAAAEETVAQLKQLEVRVFCRSCDVRQSEDAREFVQEAREELGTLQVLVNNAGIGRDRALWHMSDEEWDDVLRTNLTGAFNMIRAVAPILREEQQGKIVNVSSIHALRSEFGLANYSASKAGLLGLTRSAAVELGPSNVNVNAVAPGYIRTTRLTEKVPAEVLDRARERSALGRLGDPQDVAQVVVFLCSERARHITGAVIPIDGGHIL